MDIYAYSYVSTLSKLFILSFDFTAIPSEPRNIKVNIENNRAQIVWENPLNDGGLTDISYRLLETYNVYFYYLFKNFRIFSFETIYNKIILI